MLELIKYTARKKMNKMSVTLNQGLKPYQESITHEIGSLKTAVGIALPEMLLSSTGSIAKAIYKLFKRTFSVYMENDEDWIKL